MNVTQLNKICSKNIAQVQLHVPTVLFYFFNISIVYFLYIYLFFAYCILLLLSYVKTRNLISSKHFSKFGEFLWFVNKLFKKKLIKQNKAKRIPFSVKTKTMVSWKRANKQLFLFWPKHGTVNLPNNQDNSWCLKKKSQLDMWFYHWQNLTSQKISTIFSGFLSFIYQIHKFL